MPKLSLPHDCCLLKQFKTAAKKAEAAAKPPDKPSKDPVSCFLSSRLPGPAEFFAQYNRGHWGGCEIRNLRVRDELWKADETRSGNWALNACLAILRVALTSLKFRQCVTCSWPQAFKRCSHSSVAAMSLINGKPIE
jgi:hypothetical protein